MRASKESEVVKILLLCKRESIYFKEIKTEPSVYSTSTKGIPNSGLSLPNTIIDHKKK
jgi:hypothetical protein